MSYDAGIMHRSLLTIRSATADDRDAIWNIFRVVVATGDTWSFEPTTPRDEALAYWFAPANRCFVAEREGRIVGTYILKPNHGGPGSHVANAGFMVAPDAQGGGIGRGMGEHALREARRLGFRSVRIIHGKGVGVQREIVRKILERTPFVIDCTDAPPQAGGLGATIVRLEEP